MPRQHRIITRVLNSKMEFVHDFSIAQRTTKRTTKIAMHREYPKVASIRAAASTVAVVVIPVVVELVIVIILAIVEVLVVTWMRKVAGIAVLRIGGMPRR
jgi:ABC-type lipoprotein release transport system permease subunit